MENQGQLDSRVSYYSKLPGHSVFFTKDKIVFELTRRKGKKRIENGKLRIENEEKGKAGDRRPGVKDHDKEPVERMVFHLKLENSRGNPFITGEDKQEGKVNYFTGNDQSKWRKNIPAYKAVAYREVYPGIDMKLGKKLNIFLHGLCWIHAERTIAKIIPFTQNQRSDLERIRKRIWNLYDDLKLYSETDIREYVKRRKTSGGTRSGTGRKCRDTFTSLKKTCRKLGVSFLEYLRDRKSRTNCIPSIRDLMRCRSLTSTY